MNTPLMISVDEPSRIAEVRRRVTTAAAEQGLTEARASDAGIIATETATNLLKHARGGEIYVSSLSPYGSEGVELVAIDRGPGIHDVQQSIADGYSTAGTSGTGLGAIRRLSSSFDLYTQPGKGTVLHSRISSHGYKEPGKEGSYTEIAAISVPYRGEIACGDAWGIRQSREVLLLMVADGLGHGLLAADASGAAALVFGKHQGGSPAQLLEQVHQGLRSTRGAAVAISAIDTRARKVRYAGLGNIAGAILGGPKLQSMLSHNGTAGHEARRFQEFEYTLPDDALIVMHSDGLTSSWTLDQYPGLMRRHPAVIAGVLYRDANRGRDDLCVVVLRSRTA